MTPEEMVLKKEIWHQEKNLTAGSYYWVQMEWKDGADYFGYEPSFWNGSNWRFIERSRSAHPQVVAILAPARAELDILGPVNIQLGVVAVENGHTEHAALALRRLAINLQGETDSLPAFLAVLNAPAGTIITVKEPSKEERSFQKGCPVYGSEAWISMPSKSFSCRKLSSQSSSSESESGTITASGDAS